MREASEFPLIPIGCKPWQYTVLGFSARNIVFLASAVRVLLILPETSLYIFTIPCQNSSCQPGNFHMSEIISFFVTVHAYVPSNGICRGFAFKYGKFLLPPRFLTALSVPKVPTCETVTIISSFVFILFSTALFYVLFWFFSFFSLLSWFSLFIFVRRLFNCA